MRGLKALIVCLCFSNGSQRLLGLNSRDLSIFLEYLGGYILKGWSCNDLDSRRVIVLIALFKFLVFCFPSVKCFVTHELAAFLESSLPIKGPWTCTLGINE